ncbi:MAG: hypothetical protein ACAI38_16825 [Myxococcota bacterium]
MHVYGDPQIEVDLARLWRDLAARVTRLPADPPTDALRELLIASGMVEQAAHDALAGKRDHRAHPFVARMHAITDFAARAFHADWLRSAAQAGALAEATRVQPPRTYVHALKRETRARVEPKHAILKIPEGFAYNSLYPEQYCAATWAFIGARKARLTGSVLVVGVRSIGTTLSAIVAAALDCAGIDNHRMTVRPSGSPTSRELVLDKNVLAGASHAIVVDEGPWTSGSSMAAVGFALERLGLPREAIAFLPSHRNGPGPKASPDVRAMWNEVAIFSVPVTAPIFGGRTLREHLNHELANTLGVRAELLPDEDWRRLAYDDPGDWPPSRGRFATSRYRVRTTSGSLALEFGGTATIDGQSMVAQALAACEQRTFGGFAPAPIGMVAGYLARPWLEGTALRPSDVDAKLLSSLSHYVSAMAGLPLDSAALAAAQLRRADWASRHLADALGDSAAKRAAAYVEAGSVLPPAWARAAFDYDLAPRCWMRTSEGAIARVGSAATAHGHTVVGVQPVLWDVASLLVEWDLGRKEARAVVAEVEAGLGGTRLPRPALRAFMLAYIAFKLGELAACQAEADDAAELSRIHDAIGGYCKQVDRLLQ